MHRIDETFKNKKPFIGYLTGGDGGLDYSVACAQALIRGGVDILEIGFPFSDPVADGPVIQKAHERALENRANSTMILEIARRIRESSEVPLVLFSYFNPLLQLGKEYLQQLKTVGYDAVLIVDLPIPFRDEIDPFFLEVLNIGLAPILLATPSSSDQRLSQISTYARGFLYYVSHKGTTGVRANLAEDFATKISRMRQHFSIPIVSGFGIGDRESAKEALEFADGFVVGSAFVEKIGEKTPLEELTLFARSIDPR